MEQASVRQWAFIYLKITTDLPKPLFTFTGGWYTGDKSNISARNVFTTARVCVHHYQLSTYSYHRKQIQPAQMQDIDRVIVLISQKQQEWSLPDDKLALFGGSAGAHLSMLYAHKYHTNGKVKAVVSMSGPTDLADSILRNISIGGASIGAMIESYIGVSFTAQPSDWQAARPVSYLTSRSVPSLFVNGTIDTAVPYQ